MYIKKNGENGIPKERSKLQIFRNFGLIKIVVIASFASVHQMKNLCTFICFSFFLIKITTKLGNKRLVQMF
jgi:hypothetical protein